MIPIKVIICWILMFGTIHNVRIAAPTLNAPSLPNVSGVATWYDVGNGLYAAAGPALRVGHWRGRTVRVCSAGKCVRVRLTDWCACGKRGSAQTLLDLSADAFRHLAPLSRGVIKVTVSW